MAAKGRRQKPATKAKKKTAPARPKPRRAPAPASLDRFDRGAYALPPMDIEEAVRLATDLLATKPAKTPAAIAEEALVLVRARDRARAARKTDDASPLAARPFDVAMDRAWETFVRRIVDHAGLPAARQPDARDLATVCRIVEDLSILKLDYLAEFAQIGARVDALKREGLLDLARSLAGDAFHDEVLRCHAEYGAALGVGAAPKPAGPDRGAARLALLDAIGEYAVQLMAQARAGRPDTWSAVHAALAPIARLRDRQREVRGETPLRAPPAHPVA